MHRVNTYHSKPNTDPVPNINNHHPIQHVEDEKNQTLSEMKKQVNYGHTVADVEQQILDWLKELDDSRK